MSQPHDHHHEHGHAPRPLAERPTMSLLRVSAWQRLAGAGVILAALWLTVFAALG